MQIASSADSRRKRGAISAWLGSHVGGRRPVAALGPTWALTVTVAVACFVLILVPTELLVEPTRVGPPLNIEQKQNAETALYLAAFALILPLALIAVPRLADAIGAGPNGEGLSLIAACLATALAAGILLARVLPGAGLVELLFGACVWWVLAVAVLARARRPERWDPILRWAPLAPFAWTLAAALVLGAMLAFTHTGSISALPMAFGIVAAGLAVAFTSARRGSSLPALQGRWGLLLDVALGGLLLLAVCDLVVFSTGDVSTDTRGAAQIPVIQFHHDFVLGPTNLVLHGGAVLVDTASQYGIGSIYFLAGWFGLAPIGYGTLGFLDAALFGVAYVTGYLVLRLAGTPRWVAAVALGGAVVALIYNLLYSVGSLPAQHGPLRFGLPLVVVLAAVLEVRWPRRAHAARAGQLVVVGVASIWALEAFAYTVLTFTALACFMAWTGPAPRRLSWLARQASLALMACLAVHLTFIAATVVLRGEWPDYGSYLAFLWEFLFGALGDLTYDFSRWSPALAVGAGYAASVAALLLLAHRRPQVLERERVALVAVCGATTYGIALFSYFVDRSADYILPYVSLPAFLVGALWLGLLLRGELSTSRAVRVGGLAAALALFVLVGSVAWSSIGDRFPRSALAHVLPGGDSTRAALARLRNLPPLDSRTPQGESLVKRFMPGQPTVLSVVAPDLETEILMRTDRTNALPFSFPPEDSFVATRHLPELRRAVDALAPGDRLLTQQVGLDVLAALERQPARDPLADPVAPTQLAPLQEWVLQRIDGRFDLRVLHRDDDGFVVASLAARE